MRLLLAAVAVVAALPVAASANPGACATTINSKGVETTVCNPGEPPSGEPACYVYDPGYALRPVPYVKVCAAL